ncbi:hypothetical protein BW686_16025 [Pseudomonas syringae]|uniref:Uncharacterized protein n=1 Tax=Pseudomonas syringae TaxID=317 RepID=A0A244EQ63_PSESX|nr:hypothetical protein [Pseudomonas syringae]MCI3944932.1 hypothetical protein [Pseudomonas syringae]OUM06596.1 hypothetical protein BW686_16025 [Pseudomonas syringae]
MDLIKDALPFLAAVAALVTIIRGIAALILIAPENRRKILDSVRMWLSTAVMMVILTGGVAIGLASGWQVLKFGLITDPMTRKDVLMLLINSWNMFAYLGCAIAIPLISRAIREREETHRFDAQT